MILDLAGEKNKINGLIHAGIQEILHKGLRVSGNNLGNLEDDFNLFMKALKMKNKVYDFACMLSHNDLFNRFEGIIVYTLINSDEPQYEQEIKFNF